MQELAMQCNAERTRALHYCKNHQKSSGRNMINDVSWSSMHALTIVAALCADWSVIDTFAFYGPIVCGFLRLLANLSRRFACVELLPISPNTLRHLTIRIHCNTSPVLTTIFPLTAVDATIWPCEYALSSLYIVEVTTFVGCPTRPPHFAMSAHMTTLPSASVGTAIGKGIRSFTIHPISSKLALVGDTISGAINSFTMLLSP
mmetsp:Transcript_102645/g.162192  ORF Transcript_102645/g.162192 Transcript_102645/m.162192 type:complete len:203 (+) Transcript_102645:98-706(+)